MRKKVLILILMLACLSGCNSSKKSEKETVQEDEDTAYSENNNGESGFLKINRDDFAKRYSDAVSEFVSMEKTGQFSEDGYDFYEYTIQPSGSFSGCIINISYDSDENIRDLIIRVPRGTTTYYYAANAISVILDNNDFSGILEYLDVTESGDGDDCKNSANEDWGNIVFERDGDVQIFAVMFYR